jgi:hypothetical protein
MFITPASKVFVPVRVKRTAVNVPDNATDEFEKELTVVALYPVYVAIQVLVVESKRTIVIIPTIAFEAVKLCIGIPVPGCEEADVGVVVRLCEPPEYPEVTYVGVPP